MYYVFCSACPDEEWIEKYETKEEVQEAINDHADVIFNIIEGKEISFDSFDE